MELALAYRAPSLFSSQGDNSLLKFAPNVRRAPVFFDGAVRDPLLLRDALLNLHDVVTSDFDTRLTSDDWNRILDPVCTVAPDELFFEAFSQDESSYGRVAARPELLQKIERWESGTTNVDFTNGLANSIAAMRSSSCAALRVDPDAFSVQVEGKTTREKKVKLPPSWLRGFLNVQSAMTGELASFEMNRADLRNILAFMKTHKEKIGPRALVFQLRPGRKSRRAVRAVESQNRAFRFGLSRNAGNRSAAFRAPSPVVAQSHFAQNAKPDSSFGGQRIAQFLERQFGRRKFSLGGFGLDNATFRIVGLVPGRKRVLDERRNAGRCPENDARR